MKKTNIRVQREEFIEFDGERHNKVRLELFPKDLALYWQRCGLTANFGASFAAFCFPKIKNAENALSVILNELVENAVKYSSDDNKQITIALCESEGFLYFEVDNYITERQDGIFRREVSSIEDMDDINQAYIDAMERSMTGEDSRLGLLTILNDYKVTMAFTFSEDRNHAKKVAIQVRISPEDIQC